MSLFVNDAKMERSELFRELSERGVATAVVNFSGGNDEGGVDSISLLDAAGKEIGTLTEHYDYSVNPATGRQELTPRTKDDQLTEALSEPVDDKYGGFAGEFHVYGNITWDVANRTVKMQGHESVETYESFEDEDI